MLTFFHLLTFFIFCIGLSIILFNRNLYDDPKILNSLKYKILNSDLKHIYFKPNSYEKRLPSAIIIGVKKCGTRALLHFLKVHPKIKVVGPEIHFFDRKQIYEKGIQWYIKQMPRSRPDQITIEKTPSYFVTTGVPYRMKRTLSRHVKLIVVVRDPVTRALSDYVQALSKRNSGLNLHGRSFESLVFNEKPQLFTESGAGDKSDFDQISHPYVNQDRRVIDTNWSAIRLGLYARYLNDWKPHFDLGRDMHFIDGERLVRDPASVVAGVEDFLSLPRFVNREMFVYEHPIKNFPCLRAGLSYNNKSTSPDCLGHTKGRPHPIVSAETIQRLRQYYLPFNVEFFRMINQTFDWS